jgi:hypothetical protein
MEAAVLGPGSPRESIEQARGVLAAFLQEFCKVAAAGLHAQREFLRCCKPLLGESGAKPEVWDLDMADVTRAMRRVERARRLPLPRARRELNRLMVLLDGVPFERLVVAEAEVTATVRPLVAEGASAPGNAFEICLPLPPSPHFPVFIRRSTAAGQELMFIQPGRHGACRGEATPLLETAVERLDLCGLVLVTLAWARRNL